VTAVRTLPPCYGLGTEPGLPPFAEAASLAMGLLRAAKLAVWSEFYDAEQQAMILPWEVILTEDQLALLDIHQHLFAILRRSLPVVKDPATKAEIEPAQPGVTVAVCPVCQRWIALSSGAAPARCTMRVGCGGKPVKAPAAKKVLAPG
jgi:hypothetical protein